jgi:pyruvate-formate lyase-activating enzyme
LIPEYIDYLEIENIARFIAAVDKGIPYRIDAYIPIGSNPWRRPTPEEMQRAVSTARRHLLNVSYLAGNEDLKFNVLRIF